MMPGRKPISSVYGIDTPDYIKWFVYFVVLYPDRTVDPSILDCQKGACIMAKYQKSYDRTFKLEPCVNGGLEVQHSC